METETDYLNQMASDFFGIKYLYPYQRLVISNILSAAGKESEALPRQIVILPTGYGKSLCYMLPSVILEKPTVVLSPLLSLVQDQARRIRNSGIPVSILTGSQGKEEKEKSINDIRSGKSRILLTNPESLYPAASSFFMPDKNGNTLISHLVVDEAHTVPEWGETFRAALIKTGEIIDIIKPECTTAFTATATPLIFEKIRKLIFADNQVNIIAGNPDRENIFYRVIPTICMDRDTAVISEKAEKPLLIFCSSRADTEITARKLRGALGNEEIFFYHAGLEKEEKEAVEKWFFASKTGILVATCAYGLGIDKPDIRTVIHRGPPQSVEAYLQESGRAGRDGHKSEAVLLHYYGKSDNPSARPRRQEAETGRDLHADRAKQMTDYAENTLICRRDKLLSLFSEETPVCSGCDICAKTEQKDPYGKKEIITLIKNNMRALKESDIAEILSGMGSNQGKHLLYRMSESYRALSGWQPEEIQEALLLLRKAKLVKTGKYLWKGLYSI